MWCAHNWTAVQRGPDAEGKMWLMLFGGDEARSSSMAIADVRRDYAPQPLSGFPHFATQMSFGAKHFCVVTCDGRLFTGGRGENGELARAVCASADVQPLAEVSAPLEASAGVFERVSCGPSTTVAVLVRRGRGTHVRTVWGSGSNFAWQLAPGSPAPRTALLQLNISPLTPDGRNSSTENVLVAAGYKTYVAVGCVVGEMGADAPMDGECSELRVARNADDEPWRARAPIKHLVAGRYHALVAYDDARRLRVFGWGCNWDRQMGFPASGEWIARPTEIEFACPEQPADAFPSMLAACESCSLIMVGGRVWGMGWHNSHLYYAQGGREQPWCRDEHMDVQPIDQRWFEHHEIAYVGVGPSHAAFLSTCGQVYVRGHYGSNSENFANNGLPTSAGPSGRNMCQQRLLLFPRLVPAELFGGLPAVRFDLPAELLVALLMSKHARLGRASALGLLLPEDLLRRICDCTSAAPFLR